MGSSISTWALAISCRAISVGTAVQASVTRNGRACLGTASEDSASEPPLRRESLLLDPAQAQLVFHGWLGGLGFVLPCSIWPDVSRGNSCSCRCPGQSRSPGDGRFPAGAPRGGSVLRAGHQGGSYGKC